MKKAIVVAALAAAVVMLQGCASTEPALAASNNAGASRADTKPSPEDFPSLDQAFWKQGAFPSAESLRAMRPGMSKDQVRLLLSWPHFQEAAWGVREWNYIFHFRTAEDSSIRTCQYMVRFDDEGVSTGNWWKDPACAAFVSQGATAANLQAAQTAPSR